MALSFLNQAEGHGDTIRDLYATPANAPGRTARIAETHHRQGEAFKLAEVYATLAVAQELAEVRRLLVSRVVGL